MLHQILVPLDGSIRAERALAHAAMLGRAFHKGLIFLQVIPEISALDQMLWPQGGVTTPNPNPVVAREQAATYLQALTTHWQTPDLPIQWGIQEGDPAREIVRLAAGNPAIDSIVIGSHGRSGMDRWLIGSVAEEVLQTTPVPLLFVPTHAVPPIPPSGPYRTILVPLDSSPSADLALAEAILLAQTLHADLQLVSVTPSAEDSERAGLDALWMVAVSDCQRQERAEILHAKAQRLQAAGVPAQEHLLSGDPILALLAYSRQAKADLIVMSTHGHTSLDRGWVGSVATDLIRHTTCPILLVRVPPDSRTAAHEPALVGATR